MMENIQLLLQKGLEFTRSNISQAGLNLENYLSFRKELSDKNVMTPVRY